MAADPISMRKTLDQFETIINVAQTLRAYSKTRMIPVSSHKGKAPVVTPDYALIETKAKHNLARALVAWFHENHEKLHGPDLIEQAHQLMNAYYSALKYLIKLNNPRAALSSEHFHELHGAIVAIETPDLFNDIRCLFLYVDIMNTVEINTLLRSDTSAIVKQLLKYTPDGKPFDRLALQHVVINTVNLRYVDGTKLLPIAYKVCHLLNIDPHADANAQMRITNAISQLFSAMIFIAEEGSVADEPISIAGKTSQEAFAEATKSRKARRQKSLNLFFAPEESAQSSQEEVEKKFFENIAQQILAIAQTEPDAVAEPDVVIAESASSSQSRENFAPKPSKSSPGLWIVTEEEIGASDEQPTLRVLGMAP